MQDPLFIHVCIFSAVFPRFFFFFFEHRGPRPWASRQRWQPRKLQQLRLLASRQAADARAVGGRFVGFSFIVGLFSLVIFGFWDLFWDFRIIFRIYSLGLFYYIVMLVCFDGFIKFMHVSDYTSI